ncbi:S24 family peptidase [Castellaniella ginsengisoli]|uniref:S24 family peptidase n=1 Tax=Castellaniella ginsengisoli TaxID=546114 RepID=A0AB39DNH7_9BURK
MAVHEFGNPRVADAGLVCDFSPTPTACQQRGPDLVGEFCAHDQTIAKLCYLHKQHFASNALQTHYMSRPTTNEILARNIDALMKKQGVVQTALSKRSGVAQTTISLYLNPDRRQPSKTGKVPSAKLTEVEAIATALNVSLPEILSLDMKASAPVMVYSEAANDEDHAPIRLVDAKASAGKGEIVFSDDITKILMFRRDWLAKNDAKPDQTIGFEVAGDSMADLHIIDGSVVLANRRRTDPLSKRVYVVWINGKLYVKELVKKDGMWWARSHNAARAADYPDILIDDPAARIVGRAFWCGFGL